MVNYPDSKDDFREVTGYVSGPVVDANKLKAGDQNNMRTWLDALQDTLGLGIKMGYASMKAFFDALLILVGGKVDKTGDTITGSLTVEERLIVGVDGDADAQVVNRKDQDGSTYIESRNDNNNAASEVSLAAVSRNWSEWLVVGAYPPNYSGYAPLFAGESFVFGGPVLNLWTEGSYLRMVVGGKLAADEVLRALGTGDIQIKKGDLDIETIGKGVIINSATKKWRLTINDSGTVITTDIT